MAYNPKTYYDNQRTLNFGQDLSSEQLTALKSGEIFTLVKDGKRLSVVLMDSYDTIREKAYNPQEAQ